MSLEVHLAYLKVLGEQKQESVEKRVAALKRERSKKQLKKKTFRKKKT